MTLGFAVSMLAGVASLAYVISLVCRAMIALGRGRLNDLSAQAQSRVLLAASLAPALASAALCFALVFDLAVLGCDEHGFSLQASPSVLFGGLAGLFLWRVGDGAKRAILGLCRVRSMARRLDAAVEGGTTPGVLPVEEPQAFVLGLLRPRIYLSRGLIRHTDQRDLEAVIAHETSHVRRRDPLRRWIASFGLAFHLPWIARELECLLDAANELSADADAAPPSATGDASHKRWCDWPDCMDGPELAVGLSGNNLDSRVRELLSPRPRYERPSAMFLTGLAMGVWALALLGAERVHSAAEVLLRVIGSP